MIVISTDAILQKISNFIYKASKYFNLEMTI